MVLKHTTSSLAGKLLSSGRFTGALAVWGHAHNIAVKLDASNNSMTRIKDTQDPSLTNRVIPMLDRPLEELASLRMRLPLAACQTFGSCFYAVGVCILHSGKVSLFP
jgi:hypothetical protein